MDITEKEPFSSVQKTSMSVPEMRHMLGMGKTNSYWLIKKNYFKTILVGGQIRILLNSFEKWYNSQTRYKKVNFTKKSGGDTHGIRCKKKK